MTDSGLTLKMAKCEFNKEEIKFFGYNFSEAGMKPKKLEAVKVSTQIQWGDTLVLSNA